MMTAAIAEKYTEFNSAIAHPMYYLWHCNADGSVTIVEKCTWGCEDAGAGNSDYCS